MTSSSRTQRHQRPHDRNQRTPQPPWRRCLTRLLRRIVQSGRRCPVPGRWHRSRKNRSSLETLEHRIVLTTFTPTPGIEDGAANSLRDVINQANSNNEDDIIILGPGNYALERGNGEATGQDNENLSGDFDLTESGHSITFIGAGADRTIIDPAGFDRAFQVFFEVRAIFRDLTIRNGQALDIGFERILPDQTPSYGGAILVLGGEIELDGVHLTGNLARGADGKPEFDGLRAQGGGIAIFEGSATIRNSVISGNRARGGHGGEGPNGRHGSTDGGGDGENGQDGGSGGDAIGGAIYADESDVLIENSTFLRTVRKAVPVVAAEAAAMERLVAAVVEAGMVVRAALSRAAPCISTTER